jgi:hypothetical protein
MEENKKSIYDLELHETMTVEGLPNLTLYTSVMRVPGGWIYRSYYRTHNVMSNTFVPFDSGFQLSPPPPPSRIAQHIVHDTKEGPCVCGAWHKPNDFTDYGTLKV